MKLITKSWLNYAEIDLQTCKKLLDDEFLTNSVAFHAQQVVEKCFKAVLEENNIKILKIHNLMRLYKQIEHLLKFDIDEDILEKIDDVYIETRYPGYMGMLPEGKPSITDVRELYEFAENIYKQIKLILT